MSETAILWLFGTVIGVLSLIIAGIWGALWGHITHCKDVASDVSMLKTNMTRVMQDIGTHETGLRGAVHEAANRLTEQGMKIALLENREDQR